MQYKLPNPYIRPVIVNNPFYYMQYNLLNPSKLGQCLTLSLRFWTTQALFKGFQQGHTNTNQDA